MPNIFSEKAEDLKSLFQKNHKSKGVDVEDIPTFEKEQIEHAKRIMKPFVLRRLKKDVLKDLPKKTDIKLDVDMAPTQAEQYKELVKSFQEIDTNVRKLINRHFRFVVTCGLIYSFVFFLFNDRSTVNVAV